MPETPDMEEIVQPEEPAIVSHIEPINQEPIIDPEPEEELVLEDPLPVDIGEEGDAEGEEEEEEKPELKKEPYMTKAYYMPGYVEPPDDREYPPHIRAFKNYISTIGDFEKHGYTKEEYSPDTSTFAPDSSSFAPDTSGFAPDSSGFAPDPRTMGASTIARPTG